MSKKLETILGWHILMDGTLNYDDYRRPIRGRWLRAKNDSPIEVCSNGMHAAPTPADCVNSLSFSLFDDCTFEVCRVAVRGEIVHRSGLTYTSDKFAGRSRKIISRMTLTGKLLNTARMIEKDRSLADEDQKFNRSIVRAFRRRGLPLE